MELIGELMLVWIIFFLGGCALSILFFRNMPKHSKSDKLSAKLLLKNFGPMIVFGLVAFEGLILFCISIMVNLAQ